MSWNTQLTSLLSFHSVPGRNAAMKSVQILCFTFFISALWDRSHSSCSVLLIVEECSAPLLPGQPCRELAPGDGHQGCRFWWLSECKIQLLYLTYVFVGHLRVSSAWGDLCFMNSCASFYKEKKGKSYSFYFSGWCFHFFCVMWRKGREIPLRREKRREIW